LLSQNTVTYIGSQNSGTMINNNNEGHSGAIISEIATYSENSLPLQPNVVLVLAGTNDVNRPFEPSGAPARLESLIDKILIACPDAAILVAQIPPISDPAKNKAAQDFNAAIPGIVADRTSSGAKVLTVDMSSALTTSNLVDGLHPDDIGYSLMAKAWYAGIQQAAEKGWIRAPIAFATSGNNVACSTYLSWDAKFGTIATGVGSRDAAFVSGWQPVGQLATGNVGINSILYPEGAGVRLADMNGDGRDDYLWVHPISGAVTLYINGGYSTNGGVQWISKGQIATGVGDGAGVIFADINGDGLDDYLWVAQNGDVTAYINGGEQAGGWLWKPLGVIAGGTGATRDTTRFGDIDGDGRADYFVVGSGGSLNGWLNYGYNDKPDWQPIGIIATGIGDAAGVFLYDLNNDGRADYIWLSQDGAATVYINNRGPSKGLAPTWVSAGKIATGVGAPRNEIIFGDLNGDGKKDYVRVYQQTGAIDVWINTGSGGSYVVGDGTRFADMDGNGLDDYLAISPTGAIILYYNRGYDESSKKWIWENQGQIATGVAARKDIR
jgi:lysophospholipase L1-like esterase